MVSRSIRVVLGLGFITLAGVLAGVPQFLHRFTDPFPLQTLEEYEQLNDADALPDVDPESVPYRTGKVVLVRPGSWHEARQGGMTISATDLGSANAGRVGARMDQPELDEDHWDLDDELRADLPADAATIVFCQRKRLRGQGLIVLNAETGRVHGTVPPADALTIQLTVLDRVTGVTIARCAVLVESSATLADFIKKMPLMPAGWLPGQGKR